MQFVWKFDYLGDDRRAAKIEKKLEPLAEKYEVKSRLLHLEAELAEARGEDDKEVIKRLKRELQELKEEHGEHHHFPSTR